MIAPSLALAALGGLLQFVPHPIVLSDGRSADAELAYLTVPEHHGNPASRSIQIAVTRLRGTARAGAPPIVFLPGSPEGASGSQTVALASLYPFFDAMRAEGDVIIIDYRGSGMSRPRLECAPPPWTPNTFESREHAVQSLVQSAQTCAAALQADAVDLNGYTWAEVSEDIAAVRSALGVPRISLIGFSSGTHAALAFVRHHDREVARLILVGTEGPDNTRKLPSNIDRQIRQIGALVSHDSALGAVIPDFPALVQRVVDSLNLSPATVDVTPAGLTASVHERVSGVALAFLTAKSLAGPEEFSLLPALYYSLSRGDNTILARMLQRLVRRPGINPLAYVFDAASGVSPARQTRIDFEARTALLGNAANFPFPEISAAWGMHELGADFRRAVRSDVPALFITGTLDGNTPPSQAEEIRGGFRNSRALLITNGGHGSAFTVSTAWPAMRAFLGGRAVPATAVQAPPVQFAPLPGVARRPGA